MDSASLSLIEENSALLPRAFSLPCIALVLHGITNNLPHLTLKY